MKGAAMNLKSLFETLAQVSFAVTGLLLVVVAADRDSHARWFGTKPRRVFTMATLYVTMLPGLVSICALIPPFDVEIPLWPWSAGIWGVISLITAAIIMFSIIGNRHYRNLEAKFFSPSLGMAGTALLLIILALFGSQAYQSGVREDEVEFFIGALLSFQMVLAAVNIMLLLNPSLDPENNQTAAEHGTESNKPLSELPSEVSIDSHDVYQEQASPISDSTLALSILAFALSLSNILFALLLLKQEKD